MLAKKLHRAREALHLIFRRSADARTRQNFLAIYRALSDASAYDTEYPLGLWISGTRYDVTVRVQDIFVLGEILFERQYRLTSQMPPNGFVLDAGANVGIASIWFLSQFAGIKIHAFEPESTESEVHKAWIQSPQQTYVAVAQKGEVVGTYILKPNQPGLGSHVCNCGYVVAGSARGQGVAKQMCEHSQAVAKLLSFRAMQFNLVVSTNEGAVRLWQKLGFAIVGTIPEAFNHRTKGYVSAHVMHKTLDA